MTGGAWTEEILYSFQGDPTDGTFPVGTLIFDKHGNLYGITEGNGFSSIDGGKIFKLSPPSTSGDPWTESIIWAFATSGEQGLFPAGKLLVDADGNLYGAALAGGKVKNGCNPGCGLIYELLPPKEQGELWSERILHTFGLDTNDGVSPGPDLVFRNGVLYGTTTAGGTSNQGTVYQLVRKPGRWTETVLHNFTGPEGYDPLGGLIADSLGNLYGTNFNGNSACVSPEGCGSIWELSPPSTAGDPWKETTLHTFRGGGDGANPEGPLSRDKLGDIYGTAVLGGRHFGTIYKLKPPAVPNGDWTLVFIYNFSPHNGDGRYPAGGLMQFDNVLYGTTGAGGNGAGTVFSVVP